MIYEIIQLNQLIKNHWRKQAVFSLKQTVNLLRIFSLNRRNSQLPQCLFTCNNNKFKLCAKSIKP